MNCYVIKTCLILLYLVAISKLLASQRHYRSVIYQGKMDILTLILLFVICSCLLIISYLRRHRGYLENLPIPLEKTPFLYGTEPLDIHNVIIHEYHMQQVKKHGKTWSCYRGGVPMINTIDPEILKAIYVKNFDCFTETIEHERTFRDNEKFLGFLGGDMWRILRRKMSPSFTSGKLKGMLYPMEGPIKDTLDQLLKRANMASIVNVQQTFQDMACVVVARCAFGIDIDRAKASETDQRILEMGRKLGQTFTFDKESNREFQMALHFPFITKFFPAYPDNFYQFQHAIKAMLKVRKESGIVKNDFCQLIQELLGDTRIPKDIVYAQASIFYLAGVETVSTALSSFVYVMAKHPKVQEQLYQEIIGTLNFDQLEHVKIYELKFLHACLFETLRIFPPLHQHQRICTRDCEIKGIFFKKNTYINLPIYACHHLEEHFENPETFKPERFFDEKMAGISDPNFLFRPFGGGPRLCIGQRFAFAELKLAIVLMMQKMKFSEIPGVTELKFNPGDIFFLNFSEVNVKIEERK